ncbi:hypothetical protein B0F90DRAFT_1809431 [Multifurca ochricompacta]|uniref:Metal homeostatis protein bsd2 n=1 Tax=Multifurca ochricompacta TaxID=376703 RepID=A0AAD4QPU5_9AGAM|nr:hypothetical protein B0F90DRAFT_1809431 [Multifurca ochricompacta]
MDDAFDSDDDQDNHGETTPLTFHQPRSPVSAGPPPSRDGPQVTSSAYDFERDYDYPPPGSPPSLSTFALPNNYGNSNGYLPTSPLVRSPQPSIFRRTFGSLLPQYYQRVSDSRPRGGGTDNDGVFANVTAKPTPPVSVTTDNGDVYMVPEETQQEAPPSYTTASADVAPSYWETTVHAPSALDLNGDMIIDELPTGSVLLFVLTTLISWFFQLPGFILTYLLHGTHAGRFGSQAGLALTLIQYGFGTTVMNAFPSPDEPPSDGLGLGPAPGGGNPLADGLPYGGVLDGGMMGNSTMDGNDPALADMQMVYTGHEWMSFILMTIGWFLLLTSMIGYFRVKRFELSRDIALRRNLEDVFGISVVFEPESATAGFTPPHSANRVSQRGLFRTSEELRLENDLRDAGLL